MHGGSTFRSKRPFWLGMVVFIPAVAGMLFVFTEFRLAGIPLLLLSIFTVPTWFRTKYTIQGDGRLQIVCGLSYNKTFRISEITRIRKTNNVMSAPALSLDRIELKFSNKQLVMISPADRDGFIARLLEVNPAIETGR